MIKLILPYPVSANRYWRTYVPRGRRNAITVVSAEAQKYKQIVLATARNSGVLMPLKGRVSVDYKLYPRRPKDWFRRSKQNRNWDDTVQCIDLDNAQKVMLDALKNVVFEDDSWVRKITGERVEPDENGARVEVCITRC